MADSNLKIVVSAEDKATPALNKIKQAFDQYQRSYETIGQFTARQQAEANALSTANTKLAASANAASGANKGLFTTFTLATVAANAITGAVSFATRQFGESIEAANTYQSALAGLSSYAATFGNTSQQATAAVTALTSDGILPSVNAANALKNLLASGLNLEQAASLVKTFEDRAAFGRNQTIGFGQAVENLSQAFKTEQSQAGDASGLTENFSQILEVGAAQMGKNVDQLTSLERAQAKLIGIQQLSIATQGDAARYADTAAGAQARLEYQVKQTQIAFGTALQPAIQLISQALIDLGNSFNLSGDGMKSAQMFVTTLAFAVVNAANVIIGAVQTIVGAFQAIQTGSLKPLEDAVKGSYIRIANGAVSYEQKMQDIAQGTADTRIDEARRATDQISREAAKQAAAVQKQLDRENQNFTDAMEQRARQFQQSMTDMIIAHRDKARSIRSDIKDENAAYAEQVAERKQQLTDKLLSLEESHQQKVEDITQQITDEKGKGLVVDGVLYQQANQKKIDELERQLAKEQTAYQKSVVDTQAKYDSDVAADKKRHDDKLVNLQTSLNQETAILQKHSAEVAAVGEQQKEDDISRLQRQFAEENARTLQQHQQRLKDIREQGAAQGTAYGVSLANAQRDALNVKTPELRAASAAAGRSISDAMWNSFKDTMRRQLSNLGGELSGFFSRALTDMTKFARIYPGNAIGQALGGLLKEGLKALHVPGFASGTQFAPGGMALVGERGPELVNLPRGSQVIPSPQSRQMMNSGGQSITIGSVNLYNQTDTRAFLNEIAFALD